MFSPPQRIFGAHGGDRYRIALECALEAGYRHVDTTQMYGNEHIVGEVLEAAGEAGRAMAITTKVLPDNYGADRFLPSVERSLELLRRDRADALLLHWPPLDGGPIEPSLELLQEAHARGLAEHIGVSNYTAAMLRRAKGFCSVPLACNQIEFHPLLDQGTMLAAAAETGIPLTAYCSLARGAVLEHPLFAEIGASRGRSAIQVALRWIIHKGVSPLTGSDDPDHIRGNFDCLGFELEPGEIERIDAHARATNYRIVTDELMPGAPEWD